MGRLTDFRDSLFNLITGLGTGKDPTSASRWHLRLLSRQEVEFAYRADWVARKIIDSPAEDATREWRSWQADQKVIQAIEAVEELHNLQKKMYQAIVRARLYGGAAMVFAVKGQDPASELVMDTVKKGDLEFVVVMNRYELMAGPRIFNVESPYYTRPEYYQVATPVFGFENESGLQYPLASSDPPARQVGGGDKNRQMTPATGTVVVHPSRVIEFTGNELPDWRLIPMGGSWGDSVLQTVDDVLKDIGLVIGSIANMVNDAKLDVIKIPDFSKQIATKEYANRLLGRFAYANAAKSTVNSLVLDTNEEWQRVQSNFGGLPNILHEYLLIAGGAAGIPMSILVGQSGGRGMGQEGGGSAGVAGGDSDLKNYYDRISAKQENEYGPKMAPLDQVIVRSAIGKWDPTITYNWNPLYQDDATTIANIEVAKQNAMKIAVSNGLINEEVLRAVQIAQMSDNEEFWIGIEDAVEEYGAEPEEPDIQVPWSRLAGQLQKLGFGGSGGSDDGPDGGDGGGDSGGNGGGSPDTGLGDVPPDLASMPNMRVTKDDKPRHTIDQIIEDSKVTKDSVNYRQAEDGSSQRCGNCTMFEPPISCDHVAGHISRNDTCDDFEPNGASEAGGVGDAGPDDEPRDDHGKWTSGGGDLTKLRVGGRADEGDGRTKIKLNALSELLKQASPENLEKAWKDPHTHDRVRRAIGGEFMRRAREPAPTPTSEDLENAALRDLHSDLEATEEQLKSGPFYVDRPGGGRERTDDPDKIESAKRELSSYAETLRTRIAKYSHGGLHEALMHGDSEADNIAFIESISEFGDAGPDDEPRNDKGEWTTFAVTTPDKRILSLHNNIYSAQKQQNKISHTVTRIVRVPPYLKKGDITDSVDEFTIIPVENMGPTRTFQLIRHGATSMNNDDVSVDRIRGWQDIPLSKSGRTEAHNIARKIAKSDAPDVVYTSDLKRAADTADIIAKHCNAPKPTRTKDLRPWNLGDLAGKTTKEALPQMTAYACDTPDKAVPNGESFDSFKCRAFKGLHDILSNEKPNKNVAIVTHHRVERLLKGWKAAGYPADGGIDTDEFNKKGEPTGHAEDFDVPMDRLKAAAS